MEHLTESYDSHISEWHFSRVDDECDSPIPPILLETLSLINRGIDHKTNLVISIPGRFSFGSTLATLLTSDLLLSNDNPDYFQPEPGDKLKLGNAVVEYIEFHEASGMHRIKYLDKKQGKARAPSIVKSTLPVQYSEYLQKTDSSRELSTNAAVSKAKKEIKEQIESQGTSGIVDIVHQKTYATSTVVYVTPFGRAIQGFKETRINGTPQLDAFLCGRIDQSGDFETINAGQYEGTPSLAIAIDLYDVAQAVQSGHSLKAVLIDVDNPALLVHNNSEYLQEIIDADIPVIFVTSLSGSLELNSLRSMGFMFWRWDKATLNPLKQSDYRYFSSMVSKCNNCINYSEITYPCNNEYVNTMSEVLNALDELVPDETIDYAAYEIVKNLWFLFIDSIRSITSFSDLRMRYNLEIFAEWKSEAQSRKGYINDQTLDLLIKAINLAEVMLKTDTYTSKATALNERLTNGSLEDSLLIVMANTSDVSQANQFWLNREVANSSQVQFMSFGEFIAQRAPSQRRVLICGWFGNKKMREIFFSCVTPRLEQLVYGCEVQWSFWGHQGWKSAVLRVDDTQQIIKKLFPELCVQLPVRETPAKRQKKERAVVDEIEEARKDRAYNKYRARAGEQDVFECIPIRFAGDKIAFYKDSTYLVDVTEILDEFDSDGTVRQTRVSDTGEKKLKEGSFVVMRDTGRDVIEHVANQYYLKGDAGILRSTAGLWKTALELLYKKEFENYKDVHRLLERYGLKRDYQTIRSWFDDARIAPGNEHEKIEEAISIIAKVAGTPLSPGEITRIAKAAERVQLAHRQAGRKLTGLLSKSVLSVLQESNFSGLEELWEPIRLTIDQIGDVVLYRILDIDRDALVMVSANKIGKVFDE